MAANAATSAAQRTPWRPPRPLRRALAAVAVALCMLAGAQVTQAQTEVTLVSSLGTSALFFANGTHDSTERGLALSLSHARGAAPSGGAKALLDRATMAGLTESGVAGTGGRFEIEAAYGLPVFGGRYVGAPYSGLILYETERAYILGWRLGPPDRMAEDLALGVAATRREPVDGGPPEHHVGVTLAAGW